MKSLSGIDLTGFIKERQAQQVRGLRQADGVVPKLAIIRTHSHPVVDQYMKLKHKYGLDILIDVEIHVTPQDKIIDLIGRLNKDDQVHGVIIQLPLDDPTQTTEILNTVSIEKDVDGLAQNSKFDPATPVAINWLLAGYNIDLKNKQIVIVGQGRLVGKPLADMWQASGYNVRTADRYTTNLASETLRADILVSAVGKPGLITTNMIKSNTVIVDAGVSTDSNGLVGDIAPEVRRLPNITITPIKGGVGPLTVCALFDNVIRATRARVDRA